MCDIPLALCPAYFIYHPPTPLSVHTDIPCAHHKVCVLYQLVSFSRYLEGLQGVITGPSCLYQ